jgi:hypothetical protein
MEKLSAKERRRLAALGGKASKGRPKSKKPKGRT